MLEQARSVQGTGGGRTEEEREGSALWGGPGLGGQESSVPGLLWVWPLWIPSLTHFSSEENDSKRKPDYFNSIEKCQGQDQNPSLPQIPAKVFISSPRASAPPPYPPNHPTCTHTPPSLCLIWGGDYSTLSLAKRHQQGSFELRRLSENGRL